MPRPRLLRDVHLAPTVTYFKPAGIRMVELEEVVLTVDEFESIRLKDLEEKPEIAAANAMNVSQPTFNRIVNRARKKIAEALIMGKAIKIEGGSFRVMQK